jgi:hypothetical protein
MKYVSPIKFQPIGHQCDRFGRVIYGSDAMRVHSFHDPNSIISVNVTNHNIAAHNVLFTIRTIDYANISHAMPPMTHQSARLINHKRGSNTPIILPLI